MNTNNTSRNEMSGNLYGYDRLTGLMEMRQFLNRNEDIRDDAIRTGRKLDRWIVFMDISQFKLYNVSFGIEAGDSILKSIAGILQDVFQTDDIARFADDHFVVSIRSDRIEALVREAIKRAANLETRFVLKLRAGLYHITDVKVHTNEACDYAKMACDSIAKDAGKSVCIYDASLGEKLTTYKYIADHITEAINRGWIEIYHQPVIRSLSGDVCGVESLSRWNDPERGFISPAVFIPALEQAHLIHILDTYVVQKACENIREVMDNGDEPLPHSFNLSRFDFTDTDPVAVVEENVARYDIPRDYLCVEITETALMNDTDTIRKGMEQFQKLGYEVWMDDFGSGYSSLNTLKDFSFDEIKIDMMFLSSFTDKSRTILKSIVLMAKSMGIQSLAEGVETKEQFEFLRRIGCEKIQGYYFGKPMKSEDLKTYLSAQGVDIEPRSMRRYYTDIGQINLMSDRPIALLEHDQGRFHLVFENEACQKVMAETGINSMEEVERRLNDRGSVLYGTYERFVRKVEAGNSEQVLIYPDHEKLVRLDAKVAAQFGNRYMLRVLVQYEKERESSRRQQKLDTYLRNLVLIYEGAVAIHLKEDYVERIVANGSYEEFGQRVSGLKRCFQMFAQTLVMPEDRERYLAFTDTTTLAERIKAGGRGYITDSFMILDRKREVYVRKLAIASLAPNTDDSLAFGMMRSIEYTAGENSQHMARKGEWVSEKLLWNTLMENTRVKYFWKDAQRRYRGASRSFADYYGLNSVNDILGKSDEEIGWDIEEVGRDGNDEWDVLRDGKGIRDTHGQTVARGGVRQIVVNKRPVYDHDRIIGLLGYFMDLEDDLIPGTHLLQQHQRDPQTGFISVAQLAETLFQFIEMWHLKKRDCTLSLIRIMEYERIYRDYGEEIAEELLHIIAGKIRKGVDQRDILSRLKEADFVLCFPSQSADEAAPKIQEIIDGIESIHSVHDIKCTLFASHGEVQISESDSITEIYDLAEKRMKKNRGQRLP
ncbi:MAG: EAL domain-containing protein [Bilifractor sp.]